MNYAALDKLGTLTDDYSRTYKEGLHESPVVRSAGRRGIPNVWLLATLLLLVLATSLLLFNTWGVDVGNNFQPVYIKSTFCVENHLLPSIFVIGIQKCGTTTLNWILHRFEEIYNGKKEHHYFDHESNDTSEYWNQYPNCKDAHRTVDNTPNYSHPDSSSAANIKAFYEKLGIPLEGVSFIAMVCRNLDRLRSAYYHHVVHNRGHRVNDMMFQFNKWFEYIITNQEKERDALLRRGFYDEIFGKWFHTFPQSSFLIIDSSASFEDQQALVDTLSVFLNLENITTHAAHGNANKLEKEEWNKYNAVVAKQFYMYHEKSFVNILKQQKNVETFPKVGFSRFFMEHEGQSENVQYFWDKEKSVQ